MKLSEAKRIVIKVGTSTLTYDNGSQNLRRIEQLARVLSDLRRSGKEVVLVSSGAIGVGVERLGLRERPNTTRGRQAAAAVGQCALMFTYDKLFGEYGQTVAQVLLTPDVLEDEQRRQNASNTLECLLEMKVVPIVNENDTVAVEELEEHGEGPHTSFGDNDSLSALVAVLCKADALLILTDIEGLYDRDPRYHPDARLISVVESIDDELLCAAGGAGTSRGTGGMRSKLLAARRATGAGIHTVILKGDRPANLYDVLEDRALGTLCVAVNCKGR